MRMAFNAEPDRLSLARLLVAGQDDKCLGLGSTSRPISGLSAPLLEPMLAGVESTLNPRIPCVHGLQR